MRIYVTNNDVTLVLMIGNLINDNLDNDTSYEKDDDV